MRDEDEGLEAPGNEADWPVEIFGVAQSRRRRLEGWRIYFCDEEQSDSRRQEV